MVTGVCQCDMEYPERAPNGHSWNYLNIVLDKTLKYKVKMKCINKPPKKGSFNIEDILSLKDIC